MARKATRYVCAQCGTIHPKWNGRCDSCGAWNSLSEEDSLQLVPQGLGTLKGRKIELVGLRGDEKPPPRYISGLSEFDRVNGGGLVPGSATLLGGDPGIGKSTLLIQAAAILGGGNRVVYISGEEAIDQLRLRAARLNLAEAHVGLASTTSVRDIISTLEGTSAPDVVIIDSIQCVYVDSLDSAPGTVTQVRTSAQELIRCAKHLGFALILVGHVTKEGAIAGPRVLEHMVDTVLYFEGDPSHQFRILRSVKNRFGPTDEIGVFEMSDKGLLEVPNPSALFLTNHQSEVTGASVFAGLEGSRPMLLEIQSLIAPSQQATPRRAVVGWDSSRLAMIMAVLEARCGVVLAGSEVYLNVAGGLRIKEPAADLAVAAALISSFTGHPVISETVVFGELGLSGEVRAVSQMDVRLKEAEKLGFARAIIPAQRDKSKCNQSRASDTELQILQVEHLRDLVLLFNENNLNNFNSVLQGKA